MEILRCPEDRSALRVAADWLVAELNSAIAAGRIVNRAGKPVRQQIEAALIRSGGDVLYPIMDHIPVLLRDESIELSQIAAPETS